MKLFSKILLFFSALVTPTAMSYADYPRPWQLGFQEAVSPTMKNITSLHDMLLVIIFTVAIVVLLLIAYVCFRFNEKNNPTPSKTAHNTLLEIVWTAIPVIILLVIIIPTLRLVYFADKSEQTEMTLKITGYQWYWGYQYPDNGDINFTSNIIWDNDIKEGQIRLLEVDNRIILPVDTNIKILTTAADVIHSWAMPAFGIKIDAIPGRINETWVKIEKPGVYYGQCSELCGANHGFMPIVVEAVSKEDFAKWTESHKSSASNETPKQNAQSKNSEQVSLEQ